MFLKNSQKLCTKSQLSAPFTIFYFDVMLQNNICSSMRLFEWYHLNLYHVMESG